jgi:hypothetical protein
MHAGTDSQWYRHLLLSSFLRLSCMRSRGVLLLDLKDVLVQGPPWPLLAPGRVTVFEEIGLIQNAPWNQCACTAHTAHHRAPQPTPIPSLALPCGAACAALLRDAAPQSRGVPRHDSTQRSRDGPPLVLCTGASSRSSRRARGRRWRRCWEATRR